MAKIKDLDSSEYYINRELSWLEFNDRVMQEGLNEDLPLFERLKFLSIVSSNLDEFFMVRVAGLMQQRSADVRKRDPSGMTPAEQISAISERTHKMAAQQSKAIVDVLALLDGRGLSVIKPDRWTPEQRSFLSNHFSNEILPVLTPLGIEQLEPSPLLPGLQLMVALLISAVDDSDSPIADGDSGDNEPKIMLVPVPSQFNRFITLPAESGLCLGLLEDVISENVEMIVPGREILAKTVFRITRDADVAIQDDEAGDLLNAVESALLDRRRRSAVRLEISSGADERFREWLVEWLGLNEEDVYDIDSIIDAAAMMELVNRRGFDELKVGEWTGQVPRDLIGVEDIWQRIREKDVMLFHPYESFEPVVDVIEQAAKDPNVLAIKQTLYRTSGDSPIVHALATAAENGKQVTVLVELKARFDEARNVVWAKRLEDAGCLVIYGIAKLKTHAKALLIVRRESGRIVRYVHLATGNYNDKTAKLYSDIGMFTTDNRIASDVAAFFNLLTGYSEPTIRAGLTIAPTHLRQRFVDLIDREIQASTLDRPGLIMAKVNSLQDAEICKSLYRASQAGIKILLNVRGICCLRPGVEGVSDNIEVYSIVDRFLEHARIYYFANAGHEEVYLSSADWMTRNLDKRLEILFPVWDRGLVERVAGILKTFFADNVKARKLMPDGSYVKVRAVAGQERVRAQEVFYNEALEAAKDFSQTMVRFRPMTRPHE